MLLTEFRPKSMLVVPQHPAPRARFPVIDMHTHVEAVFRRTPTAGEKLQGTPAQRLDQIVRWMDELNIKRLMNLTGGFGPALQRTMTDIVHKHEGRIVTCTIPDYKKLNDPGYPAWQAEELARAKKVGAVGLKIQKTLGLYLREGGFKENEREPGQKGPLVKIDDPRFFPLWKAAGELKMPVFIHVTDPDAFFTPIDRYNERWEELQRHSEASFYGKDFPTKPELHAARDRVIAAHPDTIFVGLHVATHPENLDDVSAWLTKYPNTLVEISASLNDLGRQPRRARRFFEEFQGRIMFGTDASPNGVMYPQQNLEPEMYRCYFRYLETEDDYFDYSPAEVPPQGFWKAYGIGLPDPILKKVYHNNAAKLMGWDLM